VLPITAGGNAVSVLGDSNSSGSSAGPTSGSEAPTGSAATTTGEDGTAGGTQLLPSATAPVGVSGNAISVLGDSRTTDSSSSGSGSSDAVGTGSGTLGGTSGENGTLGGTQLAPSAVAPIGLSGNAISVLGDSDTTGSTAVVDPGTPIVPVTTGDTGGPVTGPAALSSSPISTLAYTGADSGPSFALMAIALLAGIALTFAGKMKHRIS
jgi:hypothetical protein